MRSSTACASVRRRSSATAPSTSSGEVSVGFVLRSLAMGRG